MAAAAFAALLATTPIVLSLEREQLASPAAPSCPVTVAQFGPAERWAPNAPRATCASSTRDVPNHILSYPLERK